jgi:hypothetical protein
MQFESSVSRQLLVLHNASYALLDETRFASGRAEGLFFVSRAQLRRARDTNDSLLPRPSTSAGVDVIPA